MMTKNGFKEAVEIINAIVAKGGILFLVNSIGTYGVKDFVFQYPHSDLLYYVDVKYKTFRYDDEDGQYDRMVVFEAEDVLRFEIDQKREEASLILA